MPSEHPHRTGGGGMTENEPLHIALTTDHRVTGTRRGKVCLCLCHGVPKKPIHRGERYFAICQFKEPLPRQQYDDVGVRHDPKERPKSH